MTSLHLHVLDSGALTRLAGSPAKIAVMVRARASLVVPATVLAESLTGDHRRDVRTNRVLRYCDIVPIDEPRARLAARLRTTATGHTASAVDATVIAVAAELPGCTVLTTDVGDLGPLAQMVVPAVAVFAV